MDHHHRGDCVRNVVQTPYFPYVSLETFQQALIITRLSRLCGGGALGRICFALSTTLHCSQSRDELLCIFPSLSFPFTLSTFHFCSGLNCSSGALLDPWLLPREVFPPSLFLKCLPHMPTLTSVKDTNR